MQTLKVKLGMYVIDIVGDNANNKKYIKKKVKGNQKSGITLKKKQTIFIAKLSSILKQKLNVVQNMLILTSHQLQH